MIRNIASIALLIAMAACAKTPTPVGPVPSQQQLAWHRMETYAFIHFGLNTFNDMEWGYGDTPASTFNPTNLDCEQWVKTLKACGMKGVILTAKHHDGFCLWPTETTDYCVKNSPYKNGQGDVVGELCEACRKHGLKFGLYLSPWDRHQSEYGREGYVAIYHQQIEELAERYAPFFEFWFDGANGGDGWYGGALEKRSIVAETYYDYARARDIIWKYSPDAMIFGGTVPTLRWIGNEEGKADATQWCLYSNDFQLLNDTKLLSTGFPDGEAWLPAEVDVSIRPGWFYHEREDSLVKTPSELMDLYCHSVGRNANLLLNFSVNKEGRIPSMDSANAVTWHKQLQSAFSDDLLQGSTVSANSTRGKRFGAANVLVDTPDQYWATEDGITKAELVFTFPKPTSMDAIVLQEYIPLGQQVKSFSISYMANGQWLSVDTDETMTTIGYKRIIRFQTITSDQLRLRFNVEKGTLCLGRVSAFLSRRQS
ncbi:MAG: alpha-L-fucosidase [Bacteroidales bacterium]|nr:alpha-L-fucosidase [Bacteroidales bacterium]